MARNDHGSALRWTILTQAADALGGQTTGGGRNYLDYMFAVSSTDIDEINRLAESHAAVATTQSWTSPEAFPEHVFLKLSSTRPTLVHRCVADSEFHLSGVDRGRRRNGY